MKYKILSFENATKLGYVDLDDYYDYEYRYGVFRMEDDKPVDMLGCDGCEPEDNTLWRNWSWIADALNAAYCAGLSIGQDNISHKSEYIQRAREILEQSHQDALATVSELLAEEDQWQEAMCREWSKGYQVGLNKAK